MFVEGISQREDKMLWTEWQKSLPNFKPLLPLSGCRLQVLHVTVLPRYVKPGN